MDPTIDVSYIAGSIHNLPDYPTSTPGFLKTIVNTNSNVYNQVGINQNGVGGTLYKMVKATVGAGTGLIFASGNSIYFLNGIGVYNPTVNVIAGIAPGTWATLGTGLTSATSTIAVSSYGMAFDNLGDLYVGGTFVDAGGVDNTKYLAKWTIGTAGDAAAWVSITPIPIVGVQIHTIINDGNGIMYMGGTFSLINDVDAANICKYEPDTGIFTALGNGLNGNCNGLNYYDGNLYASGLFSIAGDIESQNIAYWNSSTTTWNAMETGLAGACFGIVKYSATEYFAYGSITNITPSITNGPIVGRIAKWDGNTWSVAGNGLNGTIMDAVVVGTQIILASLQDGAIFIFNPSSYNISGGTLHGSTVSNGNTLLYDLSTNELYIGGIFQYQQSREIQFNNIALLKLDYQQYITGNLYNFGISMHAMTVQGEIIVFRWSGSRWDREYQSDCSCTVSGGTAFLWEASMGQDATLTCANFNIATQNGGLINHKVVGETYYLEQAVASFPTHAAASFLMRDAAGNVPTYNIQLGHGDRPQVALNYDPADQTQNQALLGCAGGVATVGDTNVFNNTRFDVNDVTQTITASAGLEPITKTKFVVSTGGNIAINQTGLNSNPLMSFINTEGDEAQIFKKSTATGGELEIINDVNVNITTLNISQVNATYRTYVVHRLDSTSVTDVTYTMVPCDPVGDPPNKYTMSMGRDDRTQVYLHQDDTDHTQCFALLHCAGGTAIVGDTVYNGTKMTVDDPNKTITLEAGSTVTLNATDNVVINTPTVYVANTLGEALINVTGEGAVRSVVAFSNTDTGLAAVYGWDPGYGGAIIQSGGAIILTAANDIHLNATTSAVSMSVANTVSLLADGDGVKIQSDPTQVGAHPATLYLQNTDSGNSAITTYDGTDMNIGGDINNLSINAATTKVLGAGGIVIGGVTDPTEFMTISYDAALSKGKIIAGPNSQLQLLSDSSMVINSGGTLGITASDAVTISANDSSITMNSSITLSALNNATITATAGDATANLIATSDVTDMRRASVNVDAADASVTMLARNDGGGEAYFSANAATGVASIVSSGDTTITGDNATINAANNISMTTSGTASTIFLDNTGGASLKLETSGGGSFSKAELFGQDNITLTTSQFITGGNLYGTWEMFRPAYGQFSSTATQNAVTVIGKPLTYDTTTNAQGIAVGGVGITQRLIPSAPGIYKVMYSIQLSKTSVAATSDANIFIRKSGSVQLNTNRQWTLVGNTPIVVSAEFIVNVLASQYIDILLQSADTTVSATAFPVSGTIPATPSIVTTMTRIG